MAKGEVFEPTSSGPEFIGKDQVRAEDSVSKERAASLSIAGVDEVAAIPKGTIDPVYEAKARVLNHAVSPLESA